MAVTARYVPSSVQVYPNTEVIEEYGSLISLNKYGVVVANGDCNSKHNRTVSHNLKGKAFKA